MQGWQKHACRSLLDTVSAERGAICRMSDSNVRALTAPTRSKTGRARTHLDFGSRSRFITSIFLIGHDGVIEPDVREAIQQRFPTIMEDGVLEQRLRDCM